MFAVRQLVHAYDGKTVLHVDDWQAGQGEWLPNDADNAFIHSLMKPCHAPGQYASWIAPPARGINNQSGEFELGGLPAGEVMVSVVAAAL